MHAYLGIFVVLVLALFILSPTFTGMVSIDTGTPLLLPQKELTLSPGDRIDIDLLAYFNNGYTFTAQGTEHVAVGVTGTRLSIIPSGDYSGTQVITVYANGADVTLQQPFIVQVSHGATGKDNYGVTGYFSYTDPVIISDPFVNAKAQSVLFQVFLPIALFVFVILGGLYFSFGKKKSYDEDLNSVNQSLNRIYATLRRIK